MLAKLRIFFIVLFIGLLATTVVRMIQNPDFIRNRIINELFVDSGDPVAEQISLGLRKEIVFLISSNDPDVSEIAMAKISAKLTNILNTFKTLSATNSIDMKKLQSFYSSYRYSYRSTKPETDPLRYDREKMERFVLNTLYNPFQQTSEAELIYDPFQLYRLAINDTWQGNFHVTDSGIIYLDYNGKKYYLVRARLNQFLDHEMRTEIAKVVMFEIEQAKNIGVDIIYSGGPIRAYEVTSSAKSDFIKLLIGSLILITLMLFFAFHNIKPFFIAVTTLVLSFTVGFCANIAIYGFFHFLVITFALAACVIGICFSYIMILFMFQASNMQVSYFRNRHIRILVVNCLAICTAYLLLATLDILIITQMVIFAISAIITTFVIVLIFIRSGQSYELVESEGVSETIESVIKLPRMLAYVLFLGLVGCGFYANSQLASNNNIDHMLESYQDIAQKEKQIRKVLNGDNFKGWYILEGNSKTDVLEKCEDIIYSLSEEDRRGVFAIWY